MDEVIKNVAQVYHNAMGYELFTLSGKPFTLSALVLLLVMVCGVFVFEFLLRRYAMPLVLKRTRLQPPLQSAISRIAGYIVIALGLFIALDAVGLNLKDAAQFYRDVMGFQLFELGGKEFNVSALVLLLVMVCAVFVFEAFFRRQAMPRLLKRTRLQPALQYAISRIAGYVVIAFGLFIALDTVGLNLSSLAIFAGAVGVGVGFGLQNIVSNFMSGLIILTERPIALGDYVDVNGTGGRVKEINLRSTMVITNDNIAIIVPNSDFIANTVTNFSHGDPKVRVRLPVGIAYGSDVQKFKQGMIDVAKANPDVMKAPEPDVFFIGFGDSSLDFELAVWADDQAFRPLRFKSALYYAIEAKLRELDIEIPFPQRDLHIRSSSHALPVEQRREAPPTIDR